MPFKHDKRTTAVGHKNPFVRTEKKVASWTTQTHIVSQGLRNKDFRQSQTYDKAQDLKEKITKGRRGNDYYAIVLTTDYRTSGIFQDGDLF